jgi:hypothetical protein
VEDAIRNLYSVHSRRQEQISPSLVDCRNRLVEKLRVLSESVSSNMLGALASDEDNIGDSIRRQWACLLQIK